MTDMRAVGKKNKINGALFEKWITNSCEVYSQNGEAFIEKTPEPFHITKKGKDGIVSGYYESMAQPDYKGILYGGHGVMFEAKHTDTDRIRQCAVTDKQAENLSVYYNFGAVCFVLVSVKFESFYRIPWTVWKNMKNLFGHMFMDEENLKPYKIKADINQIYFLDDIMKFYEMYRQADEKEGEEE